MKYHPDKNSGDKEAEQKFQQLKEAKEILCDPEKRQNYDKWRNSGLQITYKNWVGMKEHVVSVRCDYPSYMILLNHVVVLIASVYALG